MENTFVITIQNQGRALHKNFLMKFSMPKRAITPLKWSNQVATTICKFPYGLPYKSMQRFEKILFKM
jgi:hypothetical protein